MEAADGSAPPPGTPAATLLVELAATRQFVLAQICRSLLQDDLLPWARKAGLVARATARFADLRARILDAAAKAALAASLAADAGPLSLAPASAADDQPAPQPLPRRASAPRRKAAIFSERAAQRVTAAASDDEGYAPEEEGETPLGSAATSVLRTWLMDHYLHPYPSLEDKSA